MAQDATLPLAAMSYSSTLSVTVSMAFLLSQDLDNLRSTGQVFCRISLNFNVCFSSSLILGYGFRPCYEWCWHLGRVSGPLSVPWTLGSCIASPQWASSPSLVWENGSSCLQLSSRACLVRFPLAPSAQKVWQFPESAASQWICLSHVSFSARLIRTLRSGTMSYSIL